MHLSLPTQILILTLALYLFTSYMTSSFPTLSNKRICLLIAHPDDEAMFFAPSILALTRPELNNCLFILCLSSGDADDLGQVRKAELVKSAILLGVTKKEHVVVVEDARFKDGMSEVWEAREVAKVLGHYFAPKMAATAKTEAPVANIDALVTFDQVGVSGHPNHISLFHGATTFIRMLMQRHTGWECPVKVYTLTTTDVLRKYSSIVDSMVTVLACVFQKKERGEFPTPLVSVSGPLGVRRAQRAMTTAHESQMRWFRWGWIGVSRYMVVNDLVKLKVL
jgi:N-acetylglucosaminylphosphatidylinositol deacetylase